MNYKLLVVEDDILDYTLFSRALSQSGLYCQVIRKENGYEALGYLKGLSPEELPQLILSDLNMPIMTGIEMARAIRQESSLSHIPIVIQSTSNDSKDIEAAYAAGVNSYHHKRLDMGKYSQDIKNMLIYWFNRNILLKRV